MYVSVMYYYNTNVWNKLSESKRMKSSADFFSLHQTGKGTIGFHSLSH